MTPTRTQLTRDSVGADRMERWDAPPLSRDRVNAIGRNEAFSILGATEIFQRLPAAASAAGYGAYVLAIPIQLASMTTAAADLVTNYVIGHAFKVLGYSFATTTVSTGAAASQVLNLEIGSTNITGGLLTLTLAGTDTLGEKTDATAITAANTGSATATLSVLVAAAGTVFTAGSGILLIKIQNTEVSDAYAAQMGILGLASGTGVFLTTRSATGGANFQTQATTPADGDVVGYAPAASSGLIAPITAATLITFSTVVSIGSTAFETMFFSGGLAENPTDPDPTGPAGEQAIFLYDPTSEVTTGLTAAQHLNWILCHQVSATATFTATSIPVVAGQNYALDIKIGDDLKAKFYIDGVLVGTGPALTSGDSVSAYASAELTATPDGQADFNVRFIQVGRFVG